MTIDKTDLSLAQRHLIRTLYLSNTPLNQITKRLGLNQGQKVFATGIARSSNLRPKSSITRTVLKLVVLSKKIRDKDKKTKLIAATIGFELKDFGVDFELTGQSANQQSANQQQIAITMYQMHYPFTSIRKTCGAGQVFPGGLKVPNPKITQNYFYRLEREHGLHQFTEDQIIARKLLLDQIRNPLKWTVEQMIERVHLNQKLCNLPDSLFENRRETI